MSPQEFMLMQYQIIGAKEVEVGPIKGYVSNTDMQVYWHLHLNYYGFAETGKYCFISQESIASALNLSTRTIMRSLEVLEDIGLIAKRTDKLGPKKSQNLYAVLHYTLAKFDGKKLKGDTPDVAFYDPLAFTYDNQEDAEYNDTLSVLYSGRTPAIDFAEIDEKDVPY